MKVLRNLVAGLLAGAAVLLGAVALTADLTADSTPSADGRTWSAPAIATDGNRWGFTGSKTDGAHWGLTDGIHWE